MPTVLVTGANRGIGLAFARQYAAEGWRVHAGCRRPGEAGELQALAGDIRVHAVDVAQRASIRALAQALAGESLDLLLNNAGVLEDKHGFDDIPFDEFDRVIRVNALGPLAMAEEFVEQLARDGGGVVASLSSGWGSVSANDWGGNYLYGPSKAALNMITKSMGIDLAPRGIVAVAISPGWVRTAMGGEGAPLTADQSAADVRRVIAGVTAKDSGRFLGRNGQDIPW